MAFIEVDQVVKDYKIYGKSKGFWSTAKSLFARPYTLKRAVDHVSFTAEKAELIGYIGPNGAGKSTTLKMMSGILLPTAGSIRVGGLEPYKNRKENALRMGVVFGQRSQLFWDLPVDDTFDVFKKIYKVDDAIFRRNVDFYVELLGMKDFLQQPVRQLSLGQKMRANLAVALLHDPDILYLDEPTIGLDVVAKNAVREFIRAVNAEKGTTVILTTHDMDDIEIICRRLIMIDRGKLLYDGSLTDFKCSYKGESVITAEFDGPVGEFDFKDSPISVEKADGAKFWFRYDGAALSPAEVIQAVSQNRRLVNVGMQDADIEYIVRQLYLKNAGRAD